ncbi:right-handed parallel beta-helix repeat-containing protein [Natronosalvus amylolyticus]|uniref:right-handed parallel beta-helix repeat-containing protein n=1 Tax=Natronosalvus amylolyticus TaxID=2961994 RepID=UPI0020C98067|nr:PQQ-binding-like beta-propeller repeat protein [Natronosalvus amylolyticus]
MESGQRPGTDVRSTGYRRLLVLCAVFLAIVIVGGGVTAAVGVSGSTSDAVTTTAVDSTSAGEEVWGEALGEGTDATEATVVDGVVYVGTDDGEVLALDADTGEELWTKELGAAVQTAPSVVDGEVYVGTASFNEDNHLYALDAANGDERWSEPTGDTVRSSPVVYDDRVYVGTGTDTITAYHQENGTEDWSVDDGPSWATDVSPVTADGSVFVPIESGDLLALDAETGDELWEKALDTRVRSTPTYVDGTVYVTSSSLESSGCMGACYPRELPTYTHTLHALDASDGTEEWTFSDGVETTTGVTSPTVVGGSTDVVYFASARQTAYAVDASDGTLDQEYEVDEGLLTGTPTVADETVFLTTTRGFNDAAGIYAFDTDTGDEQWFFGDESVLASPIVSDGSVFVPTRAGVSDLTTYRAIDAGVGVSSQDTQAVQGTNGHTDAWTGTEPDEPIVVVEAELREEAIVEDFGDPDPDTFSVDVTLRNTGSETVTHAATLEVDGEETDVLETPVEVPAYGERDVTLESAIEEPGEYDVSVDGEFVDSLLVLPQVDTVYMADAEFESDPVLAGEEVVVEATFENLGGSGGDYDVSMLVDGVEHDTKTFDIDGNGVASVTFETSIDEAGTYDVTIDGEDGSVGVDNRSVGTIDVREEATFITDGELTQNRILVDESLPFDVTVRNIGDEEDTHQTTVQFIPVLGEDLEPTTVGTSTIPANGELEDSLAVPPNEVDEVGIYTVTLSEETAEGDEELLDIGTVQVLGDPLQFRDARLVNESVNPGESIELELIYENVKSEAVSQDVTVDRDGDEVVETIELEAYETETIRIEIDGFDEWGVYDLTVSDEKTDVDGHTETVFVGESDYFVPENGTIQEAVNAASPGDVIAVAGGTYAESVVIDKEGLEIVGFDGERPVLDGEDGSLATAFDVQADGVTIDGFEIRNYTADGNSDGAGVHVEGHTGVEFVNGSVTGSEGNAFYLWDADGLRIENTTISNTTPGSTTTQNFGARIDSSDDVEIVDSTFTQNNVSAIGHPSQSSTGGVLISGNTISDNTVVDIPSGTISNDVIALSSSGHSILDNDFTSNDGAISTSGDSSFVNNTMTDNSGGIVTWSGALVEDNVITGGTAPISTNDESTIRNNTVTDVDVMWAITTGGDSVVEDNTVSGVTGVGIDVSDNSYVLQETTVRNNSVSSDGANLVIENAIDMTITENTFDNGLVFEDIDVAAIDFLPDFPHDITDNTVGGDPLVYGQDETAPQIPDDAGQIVLLNATDADISGHEFDDVVAPIQSIGGTGLSVTDVTISGGPDVRSTDTDEWGAIALWNETDATVTNSDISSVGASGILLNDAPNAEIGENSITDADGTGVGVHFSDETHVHGNDLTNVNVGVDVFHSDRSDIEANSIESVDGTAVRLRASIDVTVDDNTIIDASTVGIRGSSPHDVDGLVVSNNDITDGDGDGIWIEESTALEVHNNSVTTNDRGIVLEWGSNMDDDGVVVSENALDQNGDVGIELGAGTGDLVNVSVTNNTIEHTQGIGFLVGSTATDVEVSLNEFVRNDDGAKYESQSGQLDLTDNGWGDATGPSGGLEDPHTGAVADGDGDSIAPWVLSGDPVENVRFDPFLGEPPAEPVEEPGTIAGMVTDADDGAPIDGADVAVVDGSDVVAETTTDGDGTYELTVDPGTYDLAVDADEYEPLTVSNLVVNEDEETTQNVDLEAAATTGTLTGEVTNASDGEAVAATVVLVDVDGLLGPAGEEYPTMTDETTGVYEHPLLEPGTYEVRFEAPGFENTTVDDLTIDTGEQTLDTVLEPIEGGDDDSDDEDSDDEDEDDSDDGEGGSPPPTMPAPAPDPASFSIESFDVPTTIDETEPVTATVTIENVGEESGTAIVELLIDGVVYETSSVDLEAGESTQLSYEIDADEFEDGSHEIQLDVDGTLESAVIDVSAVADEEDNDESDVDETDDADDTTDVGDDDDGADDDGTQAGSGDEADDEDGTQTATEDEPDDDGIETGDEDDASLDTDDDMADDSTPGFGHLAALFVLLAVAVALGRRP